MEHLDHPSPISMMSKWRVFCSFDFMVRPADSTWRVKSWRRQALVLAQALRCICLKVFKNRLYYLRHVRVCLLNHVYIHSFRSIKEATEKFPGGGGISTPAMDLKWGIWIAFRSREGEFEQTFSKNSNARGLQLGGCLSFDLTGTLYALSRIVRLWNNTHWN